MEVEAGLLLCTSLSWWVSESPAKGYEGCDSLQGMRITCPESRRRAWSRIALGLLSTL